MIKALFNKARYDIENNYLSKDGRQIKFISRFKYVTSVHTGIYIHSNETPCTLLCEIDNIPTHLIIYQSKLQFLWYYYFKPFKHIKTKVYMQENYPELLV